MARVNFDILGISELKCTGMGEFDSDDHYIYYYGEGNGIPLQCSCLENPMNSMKRQTDKILKEELPRSVGAQYATGDQWKNNSRMKRWSQSKSNAQLWM